MKKEFKIIFANPPESGETVKSYPNLGLLYLISQIRKYFPESITGYFEGNCSIEKYIEKILGEKPDIVALSVSYINSKNGIDVIREIKKTDSKIIILCGGPYPTIMPYEFLSAGADICLIGEAEETLKEVIDCLKGNSKSIKKVAGIAFRDKGAFLTNKKRAYLDDVNKLPFPYWDAVDFRRYKGYFYKRNNPEACIISSRGCQFNCNFCANPVWKLSLPWQRFRNPKNIAVEINTLVKKYGIKEIYDYSDEFNVSLGWANQVCKDIEKANLKNLRLKCQLRADNMTDEFAKNLKRAGFWFVHIGIESGNQETLDGINKKISLEQVIKSCKSLKKEGIKIGGFFMLFNIWEKNGMLHYESQEMCKKTYYFASKLLREGLLDYISWGFAVPIPGSKMFETCKKFNLIKNEDNLGVSSEDINIKLPGITESEMKAIKNRGMLLEAYYALKNGSINLRENKYIIKKTIKILKNIFI